MVSNSSQSKIGSMTAQWEHFVENFTLFSEASGGIVKLVAKNHQYLSVNKKMVFNQVKLIQPFATPRGMSFTTFLAMPSWCTTSTTASLDL